MRRLRPTAETGWAAVVDELGTMCESLARRYPQDPADVWGDVGLAVMTARGVYDPVRNPNFRKFMRWKVWEYLKDAARRRWRKRRKEVQPAEGGLDDRPQASTAGWPIDEWWDGLGADARTVVLLSVGQPPAVRAILSRSGESPSNVRRAVRMVLTKDGWDGERLTAAMTEVRAAVAALRTTHFRPATGRED